MCPQFHRCHFGGGLGGGKGRGPLERDVGAVGGERQGVVVLFEFLHPRQCFVALLRKLAALMPQRHRHFAARRLLPQRLLVDVGLYNGVGDEGGFIGVGRFH